MEKIVFLERNSVPIDFRRPSFVHTWTEYSDTNQLSVLGQLMDATIVICNKFQLGKDMLAELTHLKLIAVTATGVDNIDLEFCRAARITVCNARGYATNSVPEHALMLMLALRRNLMRYQADVREGSWTRARQFCLLDHPITDLKGATLGVIGFGKLGRAMAMLGHAIGMAILIAEHRNAPVVRAGRRAFEDVLRESDIVTLHCPLTPDTSNLIGRRELKLMNRDAILINTARGGLLEDEALLSALTSGTIAGAAIDVLREEPPASGNILVEAEMPNLIVTPHNAWASGQAMRALADQVTSNLENFVAGTPTNVVT